MVFNLESPPPSSLQALTLLLVGALKPVRFVMYCIAHLAAGIAACAVLSGMLPGPLSIACQLGNGTTVVQGLFIGELIPFFLSIVTSCSSF